MNKAIAISRGTTLRFMGKSISVKRNEAARAFTRRLIAERFGGHQTEAAKAFGVEQPTLSAFLSGKTGAGMQTLHGVARAAGVHSSWRGSEKTLQKKGISRIIALAIKTR